MTNFSCIKTQPGVKPFASHMTDVSLGMQALMGICLSGNGAGGLGVSLYQHRSLCLSAEFSASLFGVAKRNSLIKIDPGLQKAYIEREEAVPW